MEQRSGADDFDFLLGSWSIFNKRRNADGLWEEFPATHSGEKLLDGGVRIEQYDSTFPNGRRVQGLTIRAFDKTANQWSIVWLSNRSPPDFQPLVGQFREGIGEFYEVIPTPEGQPLHIRFTWDNITEHTARWQQATSSDAGTTWDTNWIMEFSR